MLCRRVLRSACGEERHYSLSDDDRDDADDVAARAGADALFAQGFFLSLSCLSSFSKCSSHIFVVFVFLQRYVLPKQGEGPSREKRVNGFFRSKIVAFAAGDESKRVVCHIEGKGDPG